MKNIHNKNVTKLAHYIIVLYAQGLRTCFGDTGILVQHLQTEVFYCFVLLNGMVRRGYINFA